MDGLKMSETAQEERIFYFGYGSNMLTERLCKRCSSAEKIQPSMGSQHLLKGYKFTFSKLSTLNVDDEGNGKGNIERTENSQDKVYGVIFSILKSEEKELDRMEGFPTENGYDKESFEIIDEKNSEENLENVMVYYKRVHATNNPKPFDWYKEYITKGAEQHKLPESYIKKLENMESKIDGLLDKRDEADQEWAKKCFPHYRS